MRGDYSNKPIFDVKVSRGEDEQVETLESFYALHYNATRVNFAAHQRKTLALAEMIAGKAREKQQSIAVLGGGIGGITCFLGLRAFGCENVRLYEAGPKPIGVQKGCYHRHGHPTAIEWPREPVSCTTDLPMLNWGAGSADAIYQQMMEDTLEGRLIERFATEGRIYFNTVVNKIERDSNQWRLRLSPQRSVYKADIVVYAMGFGRDQDTEWSRAESYWWEDNLENYLRDRHFYGAKTFVVTGRGDGALIDFSRIALGLGMVRDTVPQMLSTLRGKQFMTPAFSPEFDKEKWSELSDAEKLLRDKMSDFEDLEAWSAQEDVPDTFVHYRNELLMRLKATHAGNAKIKLVAPYDAAAPLGGRGSKGSFANRLLFATLMGLNHKGRLANEFGKIKKNKHGKPFIQRQYDDGEDGGTDPVEGELVFVRHGPGRAAYLLERLGFDVEDYKLHDPTGENYDLGKAFSVDERRECLEKLCPADSRLPSDPEVVAWDYRQTLVERYLRDIVGLKHIEVRFRRDPQQRGYLEICAPIRQDRGDEVAKDNHIKMMERGGYDLQMFGGAVAWTHREQEPIYRATSVATAGELE